MEGSLDGFETVVKRLYTDGEFIKSHPAFDEEDSPWKIGKILPFVDSYMEDSRVKCVNLLDIGGGAGWILKGVSQHLNIKHSVDVCKSALDLSPLALEYQQTTNPDLLHAINENIQSTSIGDKEFDLALAIDVIEHVPNVMGALREISRICRYAILKIPLEDTVLFNIWNQIKVNMPKRTLITDTGHVNFYSKDTIEQELAAHCGSIVAMDFTRVYEYNLRNKHRKGNVGSITRARAIIAASCCRVSPDICARLFPADSVIFLVKCR